METQYKLAKLLGSIGSLPTVDFKILRISRMVSIVAPLALAACLAVAQSRPVQDYRGTVARASHAAPLVLTAKETLKASYSDSGSSGTFSSCSSAGCGSPAEPIYSENIECPVAAHKTCTFDIQIAGQVQSSGNSITAAEDGDYQFLIDGGIPTGGGTDPNGYYAWLYPPSPFVAFGTSYNVHSTVTNSAANQVHTITVNLSCDELLGDPEGCYAYAGFQTLVVRVWTP